MVIFFEGCLTLQKLQPGDNDYGAVKMRCWDIEDKEEVLNGDTAVEINLSEISNPWCAIKPDAIYSVQHLLRGVAQFLLPCAEKENPAFTARTLEVWNEAIETQIVNNAIYHIERKGADYIRPVDCFEAVLSRVHESMLRGGIDALRNYIELVERYRENFGDVTLGGDAGTGDGAGGTGTEKEKWEAAKAGGAAEKPAADMGWVEYGEAVYRFKMERAYNDFDVTDAVAKTTITRACNKKEIISQGEGRKRKIKADSLDSFIKNSIKKAMDRVRDGAEKERGPGVGQTAEKQIKPGKKYVNREDRF
jgi:transcriptional antiterminator Rof (Rho-off)